MALSPHRRAMIAKVKIGQKQLGWDDDLYRAVLQNRYGERSATKLSDGQLIDLLGHMTDCGFRPAPPKGRARPSPRVPAMSGKIRALWRALWDLGVIAQPSEAALAAFARRQAGVDSPAWLDGAGAIKVIEGLKAMAAREAGVDWAEHANPRVCVARAQWRRLGALGVLRIPHADALDAWCQWKVADCKTAIADLDDRRLDAAIARLGAWLRRELEKRRA